jgi:long-subunit acyl-CoA synthetase (AMP-forming)
VTRAVADLPKYEQPVGVALTLNPFTVEAGELTANLKLRRAHILDKYGACLDELYDLLENGEPNSRVIVCP